MNSLARFLKYNNAVPVIAAALFLSVGGAFAASEDARDAVYASETIVQSIDNTYIANADLSNFTPTIHITGVTEDSENYYVAYAFNTIDVVDYVWRDVAEDRTMTVAKRAIEGKDLGLYVTEQLKQVVDREISYLREVQEIERQHISQKTIATAYSGLIGVFIDDKTEVLPGYTPVIPEVTADSGQQIADSASGQTASAAAAVTPSSSPPSGSASVGTGSDRTPPSIQVLGNAQARIIVGQRYNDLGAIVTDNVDSLIGYTTAVNGVTAPPGEASIDTTKEGKHSVVYTATDSAGNSAYAERTVEVYFDPAFPRPQTGTPLPAVENAATSSSASSDTSVSSSTSL